MKPSTHEFDADGNTELTLHTCRRVLFLWKNEILSIGKEKRAKKSKQRVTTWIRAPVGITEDSIAPVPVEEASAPAEDATPPVEVAPVELGSEQDEGISHDEQTPLPTSGSVENKEVDDDPTTRMTEKPFGEYPGIVPGQLCLRILVSWQHLKSASPVFRKMFAGPYLEGVADGRGLRRVFASDWDPEAFVIVLDIMHGHHRGVPRTLSLAMLAKVAIIVDYYECHEHIDVFVDIWLRALENCPPTIYGKDSMLWLLVSWVFSWADIFKSTARLALKHSERLIKVENFRSDQQ